MRKTAIFACLCLLFVLGTVQAQLKIDFSQANGAVEPGYEGYFAGDKSATAHDLYFGTDHDEVCLYGRALSVGEIAWLAGWTEPFDMP